MNLLKIRGSLAGAALGCALLLSMGAAQEIHARAASETAAQERNAQMASRPAALQARAATYDAKRETFLEGTVVAYTENAQVAPTGAQTFGGSDRAVRRLNETAVRMVDEMGKGRGGFGSTGV